MKKLFTITPLIIAATFSANTHASTEGHASESVTPPITLSENISPSKIGEEIAKKYDDINSGFGDSYAELEMVLINKRGRESKRSMRTMVLEDSAGMDKTISIFDRPADVKGTAILTKSIPGESDDQWLYMPAIKRIKRISSNSKSGSFMGSEFSYEDMGIFDVGKYSYLFLREEIINGAESFVVEQIPIDKKSGYSKRIVWHAKTDLKILKIEFYNKKNAFSKRLTASNYELHNGKYWVAKTLSMENILNSKKTILEYSNQKISNNDFDDTYFHAKTLKNIK